ncbi:hypothetical protein BDV18DRAFT_57121 [Aspergillus unguis]
MPQIPIINPSWVWADRRLRTFLVILLSLLLLLLRPLMHVNHIGFCRTTTKKVIHPNSRFFFYIDVRFIPLLDTSLPEPCCFFFFFNSFAELECKLATKLY